MLLPILFPVFNRSPVAGQPSFANQAAGPVTLAAGQIYVIPAGQFMVQPGDYTFLQVKDSITGIWKMMSTDPSAARVVLSDGQNFRLANLTGCAVGALVTNVGSGYTSAPTVTASAGGSTWTAIVGGAINATVTITTAGAGYVNPPTLLIDPPPSGGVQATAVATISAGAISAVTVTNQGAGYLTAPTITVLPDPRDTPTTNAVLTVNATLAGAQTVTAVICTAPGLPQTSVPTLAFSGGGGSSAAATLIGAYTLTGYSVGTAGAVYGNAQPVITYACGGLVTTAPGATVNPAISTDLFTPRQGQILSTSTAGGALTTGGFIIDGGLFQNLPTTMTLATNAVPTTQAVATLTIGGVTDSSIIYPI